MAERLNAKKTGLSLAIISGIISIVCALLLIVAPAFTTNLFGAIFHGLDISKIAIQMSLLRTILGTIEVIILGFIIGWLFAKVYNNI
ncbi:MAG: DUF5676 family membrane protein [Nanoarchaeota archaeon]